MSKAPTIPPEKRGMATFTETCKKRLADYRSREAELFCELTESEKQDRDWLKDYLKAKGEA